MQLLRIESSLLLHTPDNPQKLSLSRGSRHPLNSWFLWPAQVYPPISISIGSAVIVGLTNVTLRHTDNATPSVSIKYVSFLVIAGSDGERAARAYKGGLGAKPPAGSRSRAPGQGSGSKLLEAKSILALHKCKWGPNLCIFCYPVNCSNILLKEYCCVSVASSQNDRIVSCLKRVSNSARSFAALI